jgi:hypothetical protein
MAPDLGGSFLQFGFSYKAEGSTEAHDDGRAVVTAVPGRDLDINEGYAGSLVISGSLGGGLRVGQASVSRHTRRLPVGASKWKYSCLETLGHVTRLGHRQFGLGIRKCFPRAFGEQFEPAPKMFWLNRQARVNCIGMTLVSLGTKERSRPEVLNYFQVRRKIMDRTKNRTKHRAVQRYLLKVIENMDLRPPRAAA